MQKLNADLHQEISKLRVELKLKENDNQDRKKEIADLNMEISELVNSQKVQEDKLSQLRNEKQKRESELEAEIAKKGTRRSWLFILTNSRGIQALWSSSHWEFSKN